MKNICKNCAFWQNGMNPYNHKMTTYGDCKLFCSIKIVIGFIENKEADHFRTHENFGCNRFKEKDK